MLANRMKPPGSMEKKATCLKLQPSPRTDKELALQQKIVSKFTSPVPLTRDVNVSTWSTCDTSGLLQSKDLQGSINEAICPSRGFFGLALSPSLPYAREGERKVKLCLALLGRVKCYINFTVIFQVGLVF